MKKKNAALFIFLFSFFNIYAQDLADIGIFAGGSYYVGEVNPGKQFYSTHFALGFMYRYNFNKRFSVKAVINYGSVSGNDLDFDNTFQQQRGHRFSTTIWDCAAQAELNFLPYDNESTERFNFSPYVTAGLGLMALPGYSLSGPVTIPFGVGVKYNFKRRVTVGLEWSYRKTFNDNIDGLVNVTDEAGKSTIHNQDWYSLAGITISYKFFRNKKKCPVYW